jgi:hypothetical protein
MGIRRAVLKSNSQVITG